MNDLGERIIVVILTAIFLTVVILLYHAKQ